MSPSAAKLQVLDIYYSIYTPVLRKKINHSVKLNSGAGVGSLGVYTWHGLVMCVFYRVFL